MAETKRRGWLSRLLGGGKAEPESEESVAPLPTAAVQAPALDTLFGSPGQVVAVNKYAEPEPAEPAAPPPLLAGPTPQSPSVAIQSTPALDLSSLATAAATAPTVELRIVAHVSNRGDMTAGLDAWAGERGSGLHVEGLTVTATDGIDPDDIEYRAMLDDGTLTEWHCGEAYCGTRGEARPLRGIALRLTGPAAATHRISYAATFLDGSEAGPLEDGSLCAAASHASLEAVYVMVDPA